MKAGALTPAIHDVADAGLVAVLRSMKAGALTPAIRDVADLAHDVALARSMKAGALTPAILASARSCGPASSTLNEGGGSHPRNPSSSAGMPDPVRPAQ